MFRRFAAGSATASVVVAIAALGVVLIPTLSLQRVAPLTTVWCVVPLVWGLWALVAPRAWVPQRLPLWGAILGLIAGLLGAFVLNLPSKILGQTVPAPIRGMGVLIAIVLYYFLWMLVRLAYRSLGGPPSTG